ncbi:hypothetical protein CPC08DRAFT_767222 [Agrocybe pediades]|nr:hypothetical protein CPC08DRAFT_767222 [Agrocybe pediades]
MPTGPPSEIPPFGPMCATHDSLRGLSATKAYQKLEKETREAMLRVFADTHNGKTKPRRPAGYLHRGAGHRQTDLQVCTGFGPHPENAGRWFQRCNPQVCEDHHQFLPHEFDVPLVYVGHLLQMRDEIKAYLEEKRRRRAQARANRALPPPILSDEELRVGQLLDESRLVNLVIAIQQRYMKLVQRDVCAHREGFFWLIDHREFLSEHGIEIGSKVEFYDTTTKSWERCG